MCFALWIDRSIILMGEICNIKLDSLHFHTCFFSRSWHITWNTIFRSCDKLTGRVRATKQTRTPDLTLIRYSYTSSKVSAQHSAEQWKVTQGRRSNNPLGVCRTMGTIAPQIAAPSHVLLGHCTGLTSDTRLLKEITAAARALALASPACAPAALHVGAGRSSDTLGPHRAKQPGRATSNPGFCTLMKQKWLQDSNDKKVQIEMQGSPQEVLNELLLQQNRISTVLEKHLVQKPSDYMCSTTLLCGTAESLPWHKLTKQNISKM